MESIKKEVEKVLDRKIIPADITDELLRALARDVERFQSDILIDIRSIESGLNNGSFKEALFGFRECGVDHAAFVNSRGIDSEEYKDVYRLTYAIEERYGVEGEYLTLEKIR